jgi:hypothetical protein
MNQGSESSVTIDVSSHVEAGETPYDMIRIDTLDLLILTDSDMPF